MKFQFIAGYRGSLSRSHLCRMMGVTVCGLRAWLRRPPSIRQRRDMVILARIREQHRLSLGSYPHILPTISCSSLPTASTWIAVVLSWAWPSHFCSMCSGMPLTAALIPNPCRSPFGLRCGASGMFS